MITSPVQEAPAPSLGALKYPLKQGHSAEAADADLEFGGHTLQVESRSERYLPAPHAIAIEKNITT